MLKNQLLILEQIEKDLKQISSSPMGRRAFLAAMPFIVSGCALAPRKSADRYREGSNKGQKTSITVKDEQKMTQEYLPKMKKDYPAVRDQQLQNFISKVGDQVVRANGLHNNPYQYNFTLVQTPQVNAFALPAGTVFVTAPLLAMTSSEAELAGVIGHEIGHVKARHTAERMENAKKEQKNTLLYGAGGLLVGAGLGFGLAKLLCSAQDRECINRITKYGALAGGAGGLLISKYGFMMNSQEDEMEADRIGFKTSVTAGYDANEVGSFYSKLLKMEEKHKRSQGGGALASFADAMSTHPPSKERVKQMNQMAKRSGKRGVVSTESYHEAKRRVKNFQTALL